MSHKHQWQEVERFYASPPYREFEGRLSQEEREAILFGVTSIRLVCECGERAIDRILEKSMAS